MTQRQSGLAGPAAEKGLAGQARWLGRQHRSAAVTPFGDVDHMHWDEGGAHLLDAYCDALESREPGDDGPGS